MPKLTESRDDFGLLHAENGPALFDFANGVGEYYWHGLLIKSIGKVSFDIKDLKNGFNMFRTVLYFVRDGKLANYKNGRAVFTNNGGCYSVDDKGKLTGFYHGNCWRTFKHGKLDETTYDLKNTTRNYNSLEYNSYMSSLDSTSIVKESNQCYGYYDKFGRLHNRSGPAIINLDGSLEWWENGLWLAGRNADGKVDLYLITNIKLGTQTRVPKDNSTRLYDKHGVLVKLDAVNQQLHLTTETNNTITKESLSKKLLQVRCIPFRMGSIQKLSIHV